MQCGSVIFLMDSLANAAKLQQSNGYQYGVIEFFDY